MRGRSLVALLVICSCGSSGGGDGAGGRGGGGQGGAGATTGQLTCEFTPCGGSPVGSWDLVTFCATPEVTSVAPTLTFGADGKYGYTSTASGNTYSGTWAASGTQLTITVQQSSTADYCVKGDVMWWRSGSLTVVRKRAGN